MNAVSSRSAVRDVRSVLLAAVALTIGQGLLSLLVPLSMLQAGSTPLVTTLAMASFFLGQGLGALGAPRLLARVGFIRAFVVFTALVALVAHLHPYVEVAAGHALLRGINGFCFAGSLVAVEGWLTSRTPPAVRGAVLGLYMVLYYLALGGGQWVATLLPPGEAGRFGVAAAMLVVGLLPISATSREAPPPPTVTLLPPGELVERAPVGLAAAVVAGLSLGTFYAVGPVMGSLSGLDDDGVAQLMAAAVASGVLLQLPVGWLSDRWDKRSTLALVAAVLTGVSLAGLVTSGLATGLLWLWACTYAALAATLYPLAMSQVSDRMEPGELSAAAGTVLLFNAVGAVVGPVVVSGLLGALGPGAGFVSGLLGAGALTLYVRHQRSVRSPAEHPGDYLPLPRTTAVVADLSRWKDDPTVAADPQEAVAEPAVRGEGE